MKNDELKLTVEKLIMDESPLSPEKEITYKTVIRMLEEELASTKQELANYKKMVYGAYSGYVVCDGYDGYNKLTEAVRCGCWAHARRKFVEALPTDRSLLANSVAAKGVELCNEIFLLEREFEGKDGRGAQIKKPLTATEKHEQRQERLKPVLDGLFAWLNEIPVSGGTKLARAVQYCFSEKQYLCRCLENGNIPVDNNRAENAIRPFVVGRKNWLFANSVKGAEASAVVYSLAATAVANGLNVEEYFTELCRMKQILPWKEVEA